MKVKLCFLISNLEQGGAQKQFIYLIESINKDIYDVTVCLYSAKKEDVFFYELFKIKKIKIHCNPIKSRSSIFKFIETTLYIRRFLEINKFDIIQTTLYMNNILVRFSAGSYYKNRIVASIRNSMPMYNKWQLILERYYLKNSYVIINNKVGLIEFEKFVGPKLASRIFHIYNGYNKDDFSIGKSNTSNKLIIGNIGRMVFQKNQIQLLRFIQMLNHRDAEMLIIGGDGDQRPILEKYIKTHLLEQKVSLIRQTNDIAKYYSQIDVFILSSFWEGCPNVLFEAMLSKCICVISSDCNLDNFIEDKVNGFVYNGTDDDLSRVVLYIKKIFNTSLYHEICNNGYNYAKSNFNIKKMVDAYELLYHSIFSNRKTI